MEGRKYNIAIIGGGILGVSIGYFLALYSKSSVVIIEQERDVAHHTSSRNTGKVHAPFLYDPKEKKLFAKIALIGFEMWKKYSDLKGIQFKNDGVIEVATEDEQIDTLKKYVNWGIKNGLEEKDIIFLDHKQTHQIEPNISCKASILCKKDASVDYHLLTKSLKKDFTDSGGHFMFSHKVKRIISNSRYPITISFQNQKEETIHADYLINASGGNSLEMAHSMGMGRDLINLYFRGEYWIAPQEYETITSHSIYSVPKQKKYPFLDPHWIIKFDGHCEIGPNAVPVFGAYAYNLTNNFTEVMPKIKNLMIKHGFWSLLLDREFLSLVSTEINSSFSKKSMINRVKRFLPLLDPNKFTKRGLSGIRSVIINNQGNIIPETILLKNTASLNILNYNSPGATGGLPMAAMIVYDLIKDGFAQRKNDKEDLSGNENSNLWNIEEIYSRIKY